MSKNDPGTSGKKDEVAVNQEPIETDREKRITKEDWKGLYQVYDKLDREVRLDLGLMLEIPIFIKDPVVAMDYPLFGIQKIPIRLEENLMDGPTSSRVAVVDYNGDTHQLSDPIRWLKDERKFVTPQPSNKDLPIFPHIPENMDDPKEVKHPEKYIPAYNGFVSEAINNRFYHQLNVWASVQHALEFYENPFALGRPIPWGFEGNRLIVVPHAGFGENAFYDRRSKSIQFYYFGNEDHPKYTCLSHDIIVHETGHAILDGIRPLYHQVTSLQTAAFHEFIGDLTAILLVLFNHDMRHRVLLNSSGLLKAEVISDLAKEFGEVISDHPYLRSAMQSETMETVKNSHDPHSISQVLTGAMWNIFRKMAANYREKANSSSRKALYWAADRLRQLALQPLDLCPPCDIQFIDYARAVVRNYMIWDPVDENGFLPIILQEFHDRKICPCGKYQPRMDLPDKCLFNDKKSLHGNELIYHNIQSVASSRTAAYHFINDNRKILCIPMHQDVQIVDLYANDKLGMAAERLPREIVLEYAWTEQLHLDQTTVKSYDFGPLNGKSVPVTCGGTLVFDDRGNLLSWFSKPGTEHLSPDDLFIIDHKEKPTRIDKLVRSQMVIGRQRKAQILRFFAENTRRNKIGYIQPDQGNWTGFKPFSAYVDGNNVDFEMSPQMRMFSEEEGI